MTKEEKEFLIKMVKRLTKDRLYGAADYYGLLLEKNGCTYSQGEVFYGPNDND